MEGIIQYEANYFSFFLAQENIFQSHLGAKDINNPICDVNPRTIFEYFYMSVDPDQVVLSNGSPSVISN